MNSKWHTILRWYFLTTAIMVLIFSCLAPKLIILLGSLLGVLAAVGFIWLGTNILSDLLFGNDAIWQRWRRSGGSPFWDLFIELPRTYPRQDSQGRWVDVCPGCGNVVHELHHGDYESVGSVCPACGELVIASWAPESPLYEDDDLG